MALHDEQMSLTLLRSEVQALREENERLKAAGNELKDAADAAMAELRAERDAWKYEAKALALLHGVCLDALEQAVAARLQQKETT